MSAPAGTNAPESGAASEPRDGTPTRCVWCERRLGPDAVALGGRLECRACGASTTAPWPSDAELEDAYGDWYRPAEGGRRFAFAGDAVLGRTRGLLAARLDEVAPPGPILDVGAGDGTLVDALARRGRSVVGLERSSARADFRDEPIEAVEGDGTWAAVVFWHSLEHLPRPGAAIREAARLLVAGGVVIIAIPNSGSLQARTFGDDWLHLDLPRHLVHLTDETLADGLENVGINVTRTSYARGGQIVVGWLDGLVGRLPGGLDLYQSVRLPAAQSAKLNRSRRVLSLLAGVALLPVAALAAAAEVALRRGGTVYVEGRRA